MLETDCGTIAGDVHVATSGTEGTAGGAYALVFGADVVADFVIDMAELATVTVGVTDAPCGRAAVTDSGCG